METIYEIKEVVEEALQEVLEKGYFGYDSFYKEVKKLLIYGDLGEDEVDVLVSWLREKHLNEGKLCYLDSFSIFRAIYSLVSCYCLLSDHQVREFLESELGAFEISTEGNLKGPYQEKILQELKNYSLEKDSLTYFLISDNQFSNEIYVKAKPGGCRCRVRVEVDNISFVNNVQT